MRAGNLFRLARNRLLGIRPLSTPPGLARNHAELKDAVLLESALREHYFSKRTSEYLQSPEGRYDWLDHVTGRTMRARAEVIPWISELVPLGGKRVLEIGCGTGSSTVAFAEQGAKVLATEIDGDSLKVAQVRLKSYGLNADFLIQPGVPGQALEPDLILMYAVLEHMTLDERLEAIAAAWGRLKSGGLLVLVETPNRLWYFDSHTSHEDFFLWLPDDLALQYASRTKRQDFNAIARPIELSRWGRGVSYHDFELALDCRAADLPVVSSLTDWMRKQTRGARVGGRERSRRWEAMLAEIRPSIHSGFRYEYLDLILRKP